MTRLPLLKVILRVSLNGESKLPVGVCSCLSRWVFPCNELATCPECTHTHSPLIENEWMNASLQYKVFRTLLVFEAASLSVCSVLVALFSDFVHTYIIAVTCKCWWHTWLQSELTSQWEHSLSWHACVDSGGVRLAQRCGWTMVERFPKLCLHWSCLCWTPGPQDTLHSDHELASQLIDPLSEALTDEYNFTNMTWKKKVLMRSESFLCMN